MGKIEEENDGALVGSSFLQKKEAKGQLQPLCPTKDSPRLICVLLCDVGVTTHFSLSREGLSLVLGSESAGPRTTLRARHPGGSPPPPAWCLFWSLQFCLFMFLVCFCHSLLPLPLSVSFLL